MSSGSETTYSGLGAAFSGINIITSSVTMSTPVVYAGQVAITNQSGGNQLPNIPCSRSVVILQAQISGGNSFDIYMGGLSGSNVPYPPNGAVFPTFNGIKNSFPSGITNLNQVNAVGNVASGVLVYIAVN